MTDLSSLSDAQLQALYNQPAPSADLSKMSDADLMKAYGAAPQGSSALGTAKALGVGALQGSVGLLSDASDLLNKGIDKYAVNPIAHAMGMGDAPARPNNLGSESLGKLYEPQGALEQGAQTVGQFLPGMIGGPESLAVKFATRVAAPAAASEGAGALTKGTEAEPYARVAGALLGGAGASKFANMAAERSAIKAATPALADVKSEASNTYDALTSRNVATPLPQSSLDNLADDIRTTLNNKGIRPSNASSIHQAVDELRTPATTGAADVADLVAGRQSIKELLGKPDTNKAGAFVALQKIEREIEQSSPGTMAQIREADKNWGAVKASEALDKKIARADLRAAGADSGMNVGNKIRQKVADLLLSNEARYLPAETKADLEKIVRGTWTQNGMRHVANLLGGGGGLGMLASGTAGYEAGGVPGAIAGAVTGRAFKIANNRSVAKQAEQVAQNIRRRSPLGQQTPLAIPPMSNPMLQGLLSGLLARPKQQQ